jgi:glutamate 5-kinase
MAHLDWSGSSYGIGGVVTALVAAHIAALLVWVALLLRGSKPNPKPSGKQH